MSVKIRWRVRLRAGVSALVLLHSFHAKAVDMDVGLNIEARKTGVAPDCKRLRRAPGPDGPDGYYRLGLCLTYGLGGPSSSDQGVDSLRRAASGDLVEAQMALADYFQAASPAQPREALYWYRRAEKLGDARARGRADHLERRLALDAERPTPPPDTVVDPTPVELQALYRQGYHCHAVFGEQWCHIADDI